MAGYRGCSVDIERHGVQKSCFYVLVNLFEVKGKGDIAIKLAQPLVRPHYLVQTVTVLCQGLVQFRTLFMFLL